jgi:hypothetical protein
MSRTKKLLLAASVASAGLAVSTVAPASPSSLPGDAPWLRLHAAIGVPGRGVGGAVRAGAWCASQVTTDARRWTLKVAARAGSAVATVSAKKPTDTVCTPVLPAGAYDLVLSVTGNAADGVDVDVDGPQPDVDVLDAPTLDRGLHQAALLPDGRVLVAGGGSDVATPHPTLVIDPSTGEVETAPPPSVLRLRFSMVSLPDGRVLAIGSSPTDTSVVEAFDLTTKRWTPAGSLLIPRGRNLSAVLPHGRVLVVSDDEWTPTMTTTAEVFDPTTGTSTPTGLVPIKVASATAVALTDGRILVSGGDAATAAIYDPVTNAWTTTAPMTRTRWNAASTRLADGRVLVAGGMSEAATIEDGELFDPATGRWSATSAITPGGVRPGRWGATLSILPTGQALLVGGIHHGGADAVQNDPASDTWVAVTSAGDRWGHTTTVVPSGDLVVVGGPSYDMVPGSVVYRP